MSSSAFALIGDTFQARIGIWKCWFLRRGENRSTRGKTSRSREENQQQTQPACDAGSGNRDTLVGGERSHHRTIPAPLTMVQHFTVSSCSAGKVIHRGCIYPSLPRCVVNWEVQGSECLERLLVATASSLI